MDAEDETTTLRVLEKRGYAIETDWRPVRVELARPTVGWVDLHPVTFNQTGHGRQTDLTGGYFEYPPEAFTHGSLGGFMVACLSRGQQLRFHQGYQLRTVDLHDLRLLSEQPDSC